MSRPGFWLSFLIGCSPFLPVLAVPTAPPTVDLGYELHQATRSENGVYYNFSNIRYGDVLNQATRFMPPVAPQSLEHTFNDGQDTRRCAVTHPAWLYVGLEVAQGVPTANLTPVEFNVSQITPLDPEENEDCLFLDVMVPTKAFDSSRSQGWKTKAAEEGLPVLVWIYGGGFSGGYKHEQDPTGLITRSTMNDNEGVIFVAMNYRIGTFGFLPAGFTGQGSSNVGLLDQRLALEWVQKNIHLFGGDPTRVTIMGESAGGGSVLHQITAFGGVEKPPFHQAILQSPGFQPNPNPGFQGAILDQVFTNASTLLNRTVSNVQDLRQLSFEEMAFVNAAVVGGSSYGIYTFGPVVDQEFVPELPGKLLSQGRFTHSLKGLMLGLNQNEGILVTSPFMKSAEDYRRNVLSFFPTANDEVVDYIATTLYPDDLSGEYNYTTQVLRGALTTEEACFKCNTRYLTQALPDMVSDSVYKYNFDVPPAIHADDLGYTFYNGNGTLTWEGFPVDEEVALTLQDYIINFVINGSPNNGPQPNRPWFPPYSSNATVFSLSNSTLGDLLVDPQANFRCDWWQQAYYA